MAAVAKVVSSPPDLVSGGDARVEVEVHDPAPAVDHGGDGLRAPHALVLAGEAPRHVESEMWQHVLSPLFGAVAQSTSSHSS